MTYQRTYLAQAQAHLRARESGTAIALGDFSTGVSSGVDIEPYLLELEQRLGTLVDRGLNLGDFDAAARPEVHRVLDQLPLLVKVDPDFWRHLSAVRLYDVVKYRHPKTGKSKATEESGTVDGNWDNYGAKSGSVRESLIYRLYIGASLAYDREYPADPYHLCAITDVDLWQSHIVRVLSGENPLYVRSLLNWYSNRQLWLKKAGLEKQFEKAELAYKDVVKDLLRDVVKRVRRLRSNVLHEMLDSAAMMKLVEDAAQESLLQVATWGTPKGNTK